MKVYKGFVFFERNYGEYIEVGSVAVATVLLERIGAITQDMLDAMLVRRSATDGIPGRLGGARQR